MAERVAIDARRSVVLPDGVDPVVLAAAMNPAMSAWLALRRRIDFAPGSNVMVLGATGNAGRMAVQIAQHLGAASVLAAARPSARLAALLVARRDDRSRWTTPTTLGTAAGDGRRRPRLPLGHARPRRRCPRS